LHLVGILLTLNYDARNDELKILNKILQIFSPRFVL